MIYLFKYYQSFLKANCRVVSHQPRTIDPKVKILEIVAVFECIRVPEDLGFRYRKTKGRPPLTDERKKQRLEFALFLKTLDLKTITFADETSCYTFTYRSYHNRYPTSEPISVKENVHNRYKVHVWGGISYEGPTDFVVIKFFHSF